MIRPPSDNSEPGDIASDDYEAVLGGDAGAATGLDEADKKAVEEETENLREWVKGLSGDDLKSGNWFEQLVAHALATYTKTATYEWFQAKYDGAPADIIVDQRIKLAARYAALEGAASASAYSAAVVATIGTAGGASPLTLPAAGVTFLIDLAFTTQLQIRLAWDIAVLYRVPIDVDDPEDMWNLVKVAFSIKGGELLRESVLKGVPVFVRPLIKRIFSGPTLRAVQGLPVIGTYLLQRNLIKIGIPLVGIPLATGLNYWTTLLAGRHARIVFRNDARVVELAERLVRRSLHPQLMLWVGWLVIQADGKIADDEALLFRHLTRLVKERHDITDSELSAVIDVDADDVWAQVEAAEDDLSDVVKAAEAVAHVDNAITPAERAIIDELEHRASRR